MKKRYIISAALILVITTSCIAFANANNFEKELASNNTQELINKALSYSKTNQNNKVLKICDKIITLEPKNEEAYVLKVISLTNTNNSKEASIVLNQALEKLPNSSILNMQKGMFIAKGGNLKDAIPYLKKSAEIEPTDKIYMVLANIYSDTQDHKNAIAAYTKAIELNPKLVKAYVGRAKDCGDIGDYKCSLENYEILKKMYPNNPLYYHMTSLYKTNTKDLDGAMADIDKAISMVKKPEAAFYSQKAWVYLEKKEYKEAIKYAKEALKINPKDGYTQGLLVCMAYENQNYNMVIDAAQKSIKYDETSKFNHVLYSLYAKALYKTGKKEEAIEKIEYAIKIAPENKDYQETKAKMIAGEEI